MNGGVDVHSIILMNKQWLSDAREVLHGMFEVSSRGNEGSVLGMVKGWGPQLRFPVFVMKLPRPMPELQILSSI